MLSFTLPKAQEISRILNGCPVLLYYPEDLGFFKPSVFDQYTQGELAARTGIIYQQYVRLFTANEYQKTNSFYRALVEQAESRVSRITIVEALNNKGEPVHKCFIIQMPSKLTGPAKEFQNSAYLRLKNVSSPISWEEMAYIAVYHEIGHALIDTKKDSQYDVEKFCDDYAFREFQKAGGSDQAVRDYIVWRAVAGFLRQPSAYWFAQNLAWNFFGEGKPAKNHQEAYERMAELRLRTDLNSSQEGNAHNALSSSEFVRDVLNLDFNPEDPPVLGGMEHLRSVNEEDFSDQLKDIFESLARVLEHSQASTEVKHLGMLVMEGAARYMPQVVPERYKYLSLPVAERAKNSRMAVPAASSQSPPAHPEPAVL